MNEQMEKEFIQYCNTTGSKVFLAVLGLFMFFMGGLCLVTAEGLMMLMSLLFIGVGGILIWSIFSGNKRQKEFVAYLNTSGQKEMLVQDFHQAVTYLSGNLKLGTHCIYCKNCQPRGYGEIKKAYQQINRTNGAETNRFLILEDGCGKQLASVSMKLKGKSDEELSVILGYLKARNPGIHLGYK